MSFPSLPVKAFGILVLPSRCLKTTLKRSSFCWSKQLNAISIKFYFKDCNKPFSQEALSWCLESSESPSVERFQGQTLYLALLLKNPQSWANSSSDVLCNLYEEPLSTHKISENDQSSKKLHASVQD